MNNLRILVADDHAIVRQGLVSILQQSQMCEHIYEAADGECAVQLALEYKPHVIVMDISMPKVNGLEAVCQIRSQLPECKILVLTMHEEQEYVIRMTQIGVSGYVLKDSASIELLNAVKHLAQGRAYYGSHAAQVLADQCRASSISESPYARLTKREREVFHLIADGKSTKEIARLLDIGFKTAENHRGNVMRKLAVNNAAELVKFAAKNGHLI